MKRLLLAIVGAVLISGSAHSVTEVQTSWYLGPGELGPVLHWGERFYDSDSLVYSIPGQLSLMASSVNYNAWTKHTIDLDPDIEAHATILPAFVNEDGYLDLVAVIGGGENRVVWYERFPGTYSKGYTRREVGPFYTGYVATIWPWDMDLDGDIDIVASGDEGLVWFEQESSAGSTENLTFTKRRIDTSRPYLYARPGDVDNDGDTDIVTHDKSQGNMFGDLFLFRNDGGMGFSRELIWNATGLEIWRINLADFNGDSFLDIQTSMDPIYVFLNDRTGHFSRSYVNPSPPRVDGSWPNDFDADGDVDIMAATWGGGPYPSPLFWLENDGTGASFTYHLIGGESGDYGDGGMAVDVNLDGRMDALGTYVYVGWFEQRENGSFVEHQLPNSYFFHSHWVYGENLDGDPCTGDVDIDVVATKDGEFAWWENRMVTFAGSAWLESSILDAGDRASWQRFGWEDHVPSGNALRYRVRSGTSVAELLARPFSSAILFSGDSLSKYGVSPGQYFQYRIEFERTSGAPDRSPTVYEVWVEWERRGSISGGKFYDSNVNGLWDSGEAGLADWLIILEGTLEDSRHLPIGEASLTDDRPASRFSREGSHMPGQTIQLLYADSAYTDADGRYGFLELEPGTYRVSEVIPDPPPVWIATTPTEHSVTVQAGQNVTGIDFGNVVVGGIGARTIGYWKNHMERITPDMYAALEVLPAFIGCGNPDSLLTILTPRWPNMRAKLRAQLLAMTLNVLSGMVSGDAFVYLGWDIVAGELLFGVPSPSFKTAQDVLNAVELAYDWSGWTHGEQEAVKDLLDRMNNDLLFVLPVPVETDGSPPGARGAVCLGGQYGAESSGYRLFQNMPNPFGAGGTVIQFEVRGAACQVSLKVYDLGGRLVRDLTDGETAPGAYSIEWDGKANDGGTVPSGVYLYRLEAGTKVAARKMVLVR